MRFINNSKQIFYPLFAFLIAAACVVVLYAVLIQSERSTLKTVTQEKTNKLGELIASQTKNRLMSISHMARRWEAQGGTPYELWKKDADNYLADRTGIAAIEWIDPTYHVQWAEPLAENQKVIGMDIRFNDERKKYLEGAEQPNSMTLTPPIDLVQGVSGGHRVYAALYR